MVYDEESCSLLLEEMQRVGSVDVYVEHNVAREEDNATYINTSSGKQVAEGMGPSWNASTAWSEIVEDVAEHVLKRPEDLNVASPQGPQNLHATTTNASGIPTVGRETDTEYSAEGRESDSSSSDAL
ncbi:hypothetical protein J5N97_025986 [Dioscorea zingiberensis]|uniref:Uncharacterized protein n=1 Tax=Dioscorea zingiberensis TaxID=325984 RepID=A0A9D5H684_9LILI|nr:hypothetical protein J5N97_025986 [Dioscorea zingiberensis]